jgi:hypothetical protein
VSADADPVLADQARRLSLAAELTHRAGRCAAERSGGPEALVALARRLADIAAPVARAHGLVFAPAYPGVTGGVEETAGGRRLVLACTALDARDEGRAVAVIFTTLIAGRPPQVAAAPAHTPVPPDWRAPGVT